MFERSLDEEGIETRGVVFSSGRSQRNCLLRGLGIALLPDRVVQDDLRRSQLMRLHWDKAPEEAMLLTITHAEKWRSPLLREFMTMAREGIIGG